MIYVYPVLKDDVYHYPALKMSLRSLVCQGYPNIVIVGGRPKWLADSPKINYIDFEPNTKNPYYNVIQKIDMVAEIYEHFVLMNDDMIFLKNMQLSEDHMYSRLWKYLSKRRVLSKPVSLFAKSLANTAAEFENAIDYDTHFPWVVESDRWQNLWQKFNKKKLYQYKSLYGNYYKIKRKPTNDCKLQDIQQLYSWELPVVSTSNFHERVKAFREYFSYLPASPYEKPQTSWVI